MSSESQLFLFDGHSLCYRSYFAIKELTTSKGQATNAVYGFVNTLRKILREFDPQYAAVCFDAGKKTLRQEKFAQYKMQRPSMPDSLISQLPIIKEVVKACNVSFFEREGFEADDLIATLACQFSKNGVEVIIVTDDKDMYQLVNERVKIFSPRKEAILGHDELQTILGFEPSRIIDYVALAGDQVDNIPGVKGIGEVTALALMNRYKNLEDILANIDTLEPPKVKEKIVAQKDMAILSRELAILDTKVPMDVHLNQLKVKAPNGERLFELFKELEFNTLAKEFGAQKEMNIPSHPLETKEEIQKFSEKVRKNGQLAFYWETCSTTCSTPSRGEPNGGVEQVVFSLDKNEVFGCPLEKMNQLKSLFEDPKILKITYDLKSSLHLFDQLSFLPVNVFDVMLAGYLLAPVRASFSLSYLAWNHLKENLTEEDSPSRKIRVIVELFSPLFKELGEKTLLKLFEEIEMPLVTVLFKMQKQGVRIDQELLLKLSKECEGKIGQLTQNLHRLAGEEFNINSPKQLSSILFKKLNLPVVKKTKTGFSTDEDVLTRLAQNHEFPAIILEYRQLSKLKSTYIDALPKLVDPKTGRIHAQFNQAGTETGRLSSSHPNLQNIPIRTELGRQIRKAIVPSREDLLMISADYSQIELRILAHLSGDETLKQAFKKDEDIHKFTASLLFDVKEEAVNEKMRDTAKRVNFGIIYGISSFGLAKDLNIPQEKAQEFIDRYFLRYASVKKFVEETIKKCERDGFVSTLLNRRRYIPEINSPNASIKQFAQRQAMNTPVQGSAADIIKLVMINIQKAMEEKGLDSKMLMTVHDELVFEVPSNEQAEMIALIRKEMEHPLKLTVPIKASIKIGRDWLDMKEI